MIILSMPPVRCRVQGVHTSDIKQIWDLLCKLVSSNDNWVINKCLINEECKWYQRNKKMCINIRKQKTGKVPFILSC